jgi:hypothetical protein
VACTAIQVAVFKKWNILKLRSQTLTAGVVKSSGFGVEVRFDGLEILHAARDDSGPVFSTTKLKVFSDHNIHLLLQLNQVSGRR